MKKVCFIAQFAPPMHGLAKAVDTLYNSDLNEEFSLEKINITNNNFFLMNILKILKSDADIFYLTVSQSIGGNIRDLIIMNTIINIKKKKCLIHLHGGFFRELYENKMPKYQKYINYHTLGKVDGAIVLGPSLKKIFKGLVPENKIHVVPNCVDDQYLMSEKEFEEKLKRNMKEKVKHVLYLSNFIPSKGYRDVLEMAKQEKKSCLDLNRRKKYHFNFAGKFYDIKEEKYFFEFIKKNCLEDYVTYHGIVDGIKKNELLRMSEFFVLLTRYPIEGQPISILEAMGNGMVIITTDHAGIPDLVKGKVNGLVFKFNENEYFRNLIDLSDQEIKNYKLINRKTVVQMYTEEKYITNIRTIFRNL